MKYNLKCKPPPCEASAFPIVVQPPNVTDSSWNVVQVGEPFFSKVVENAIVSPGTWFVCFSENIPLFWKKILLYSKILLRKICFLLTHHHVRLLSSNAVKTFPWIPGIFAAPPRITNRETSRTVRFLTRGSVRCIVEGSDPSDVNWYRNGGELLPEYS